MESFAYTLIFWGATLIIVALLDHLDPITSVRRYLDERRHHL